MARPVEQMLDRLRVPGGGAPLALEGGRLVAADGRQFPLEGGVPVLIDESRSLFRHADYGAGGGATPLATAPNGVRPGAARWRERMSSGLLGLSSGEHDLTPADAVAIVAQTFAKARILVVGAGDALFSPPPGLDLLYSDVAPGPLVDVIADAHDLPFADAGFEAVFAVSVLEHVLDPWRCVEEIRRVLVPGGIVYAVTPFIQQVHLGCYDFTRFTPLGHRMLFRWFDEMASGLSGGSGSALSWTLENFLTSLARGRATRRWLGGLARLLGMLPRGLDRLTMARPGGWDGAGAHIFIGRKRDAPLDPRALLAGYRGAGSPRPPLNAGAGMAVSSPTR
jgi:SAM-dependent methyltransferase